MVINVAINMLHHGCLVVINGYNWINIVLNIIAVNMVANKVVIP